MGGSISDDNTRFLLTMSKDLKDKAEFVAKCEGRSLSNLIVYIISPYIESKYEKYSSSKQITDEEISELISNISAEDLKSMFESYFSKKSEDLNRIITYKDRLSNIKKSDTF